MKTNEMPITINLPTQAPEGVSQELYDAILPLVLDKALVVRRSFPNKDLKWVKAYLQEQAPKTGLSESDLYHSAHYVWREVVFNVSPIRQHQCIPVTAGFGLSRERYWDKEFMDNLSKISDSIVNAVPKHLWHGVMRWGKALGAF